MSVGLLVLLSLVAVVVLVAVVIVVVAAAKLLQATMGHHFCGLRLTNYLTH